MQVSGFYSFTFGKNVKAVSESLLLTIIDGILLSVEFVLSRSKPSSTVCCVDVSADLY